MIQRILWALLLTMTIASLGVAQLRQRGSDVRYQRDRELRELQSRHRKEMENHLTDCQREERRIQREYQQLREEIVRRYNR
jgi:peptidoglycan hydrolase CwlO-like protein